MSDNNISIENNSSVGDENNNNELLQLQNRVAQLSTTFVSAYGGLVNNLNTSVSMMQNVNNLMEQYCLNSIQIGK